LSLPTPAELTAEHWRGAGRALVAKAIAEFCYEELLIPVQEGAGRHRIEFPGNVVYRFTAKRGAYGSWFVVSGSVSRHTPGTEQEADDALRFVVDARETLGLSGDTAGHLIRELNATLAADVKLLATGGLSAAELADLPYEQLEGHQTGHPWIVPNKGRIGFSASDAQLYPPEARRPMVLPWIAVRRDLATFRGVPGLTAEQLYNTELDSAARADFTVRLTGRGLDPAAYWWLPIHPWQWDETILPLFTGQVADGLIVPLGDGPDSYLAQQSIRTFTNVTSPRRRNVKLPLSVLNTLVWRGLPTERTLAAPAVTAWVQSLAAADPFLHDHCEVILLGEVASVTVAHPVLDELPGIPYQYRELLGVIWREPLAAALRSGERARTLASLLQVDPDGRALLSELVSRSGLRPKAWLARLFAALLPPLLHFLYRYGVVFSPHGENAIVVYDAHDIPVRLAVKDFVDDVNISAKPLPELADLPTEVAAVLLREPPDYLCQFLHAGLFIGHFRYLAELAERQLGVHSAEFWRMVRAEILAYQQAFPALAERFATFDLLTERIDRLCLNRNRLLLDGYRDRPERPHAAVHGEVPNPLHIAD
jgi:siderophore synthetase component